GDFTRRVQSGVRDNHGLVALSADGATVAALGSDGLGVTTQLRERAWVALLADSGALVAMAADGSRIVTQGPTGTLRSWSREGAERGSIPLQAGDQGPGNLCGLAVSTNGDAIAVADEGQAVWLANPANKSVLRVALPAQSVASLPDGSGFAIGLV